MKMNENLIIKEQEKLLIKFKENVEELRARGILKEQALACINEAYEEVEKMIEIKKVSKRFDKIAAVSDVSLSIEQGQVFGLLGTNGAGRVHFFE